MMTGEGCGWGEGGMWVGGGMWGMGGGWEWGECYIVMTIKQDGREYYSHI